MARGMGRRRWARGDSLGRRIRGVCDGVETEST